MLAFSIQGPYVKDFMQHLFSHDTFCGFEVRGITLHSFTYFEISGESINSEETINSSEHDNLGEGINGEGNKGKSVYYSWEELRPYVRHILKGREKPRAMKLVFARAGPGELHPNAAALFMNMSYESNGAMGDKLSCTTATSQRQFDLDRSVDKLWDGWVLEFFKSKGIVAELV